jgi:protein-tyrosine phosphatase
MASMYPATSVVNPALVFLNPSMSLEPPSLSTHQNGASYVVEQPAPSRRPCGADERRATSCSHEPASACFTGRTRVELHFHLLPAVDDGPRTLGEALALARLAVADGTGLVVCTPHTHLVDVASLPARVRSLDAALRAARIPLHVAAGGEIRPGTRPTSAELQILAHGPPGRRWVLLEAPIAAPQYLEVFHANADELASRGYGVLIGHPERCAELMAPGGGLEERLRRGDRLQVNASSLTGAHGRDSREAGFDLAAQGLITVLASDAHGVHRPPLLEAALRALAARGIDGAAMVREAPRRLLCEGIPAMRDRPAA